MEDLVGTAFADALARIAEPPCTKGGKCPQFSRCASENLACRMFYNYVQRDTRPRKSLKAGVPNRAYYEKTFTEQRAGRPKQSKRVLADRQVCIVCGKSKPRKAAFPRGSTRCYACRPRRSEQMAAARRAWRDRQMAILRGELPVSLQAAQQ